MTAYDEMKKNTVESRAQLKQNEFIRFENYRGKGLRVMFVGNSITLHGIKEDIGWDRECGMAASAKENDYVHILAEKVKKIDSDAVFCICQASEWERNFMMGEKMHNNYSEARKFRADIIIMRIIENCPWRDFNHEAFYDEYGKLIDYLNAGEKAKVILTTGFWEHPGDEDIIKTASDRRYELVELGDLGKLDEMKAVGLFAHSGVSNHPGDVGMKKIAERIWSKLENLAKS